VSAGFAGITASGARRGGRDEIIASIGSSFFSAAAIT
jgi:hypothetical protein